MHHNVSQYLLNLVSFTSVPEDNTYILQRQRQQFSTYTHEPWKTSLLSCWPVCVEQPTVITETHRVINNFGNSWKLISIINFPNFHLITLIIVLFLHTLYGSLVACALLKSTTRAIFLPLIVCVYTSFVEIGTNRKPICDFLLVFRCNYMPVFYHLRDKKRFFLHISLHISVYHCYCHMTKTWYFKIKKSNIFWERWILTPSVLVPLLVSAEILATLLCTLCTCQYRQSLSHIILRIRLPSGKWPLSSVPPY